MKLKLIKLFLLFLVALATLLVAPTITYAGAETVDGYVYVQGTTTGVAGIFIKWQDASGHIRYVGTDGTGYFRFKSWQGQYNCAPDDQNCIGSNAGAAQNDRNIECQNYLSSVGVNQSSTCDFSGFGCLENPHTFSVVKPSSMPGTFTGPIVTEVSNSSTGTKRIGPFYYSGACPATAPTNLQPNIQTGTPEDAQGRGGVTPSTMLLSWSPIAGVQKYSIRVSDGFDNTQDPQSNCGTNYLCMDGYTPPNSGFPGITMAIVPGRKYTWQVYATSTSCSASAPATFTVNPAPPTQLNYSIQGLTVLGPDGQIQRMGLSWQKSSGTVDKYVVKMADQSGPAGQHDPFAINCQSLSNGDYCNENIPGDTNAIAVPVTPRHSYKWVLYATSNVAGRSLAVTSSFDVPFYNKGSCNSSCVTNTECTANGLQCIQGLCRNPKAPTSTDCQELLTTCPATDCKVANGGPTTCTGNTYLYVQRTGYPSGQCGTSCLACPAGTTSTGCGCQKNSVANACVRTPVCGPGETPQLCSTP